MSSLEKYFVKKVFNNNVILVEKDENGGELILIGKGIGFSTSCGDSFIKNELEIEKEFVPLQGEKRENYLQLLEQTDSQIISLSEEIISMIDERFSENLDSHIRIGLTDHIAFTIKRIKEGMEIANPFLAETRTLYSREYNIAQIAVNMIEEEFELKIPEGEVGFIALHIHGARKKRGVSKTLKNTSLIKDLVTKIEEKISKKIDFDSLNYARLVNHLRFALERIEKDDNNENPLLDNIKDNFEESYKLAGELAEIINERLDYQVSEDEKGFMALHLQRLKKEFKLL